MDTYIFGITAVVLIAALAILTAKVTGIFGEKLNLYVLYCLIITATYVLTILYLRFSRGF